MKNEFNIALIKELMSIDQLHEEYKDNNISYVIDATKEGDTLNITISLQEDTRKEEFENWCKSIDDDIFVETCEKFEELTGKTLHEIAEEELYDEFKTVVKELVKSKIESLQSLLID